MFSNFSNEDSLYNSSFSFRSETGMKLKLNYSLCRFKGAGHNDILEQLFIIYYYLFNYVNLLFSWKNPTLLFQFYIGSHSVYKVV